MYIYIYVDSCICLTPVLFELSAENLKHPEILISKAPLKKDLNFKGPNWKHVEGCQGFCSDGAIETDFC